MKLNTLKVREYLKECSLERLFIEELGWDRHLSTLSIEIDGCTFTLEALAEKRGVQIFQCSTDSAGNVPNYSLRRKIEKQVTKSAYEHLIIFVDHDNTMQIWQWVARQPGKPAAYREHAYYPQTQSGDALIQKLEAITIPLDEEEALDLTGAVFRLRDAFDRDRVTKRFYDGFKQEHGAFLEVILGITDRADVEWYASLMLNRLMFVYFIQMKGFLDGDQHYMRNRLQSVQERKGKGKFYTFYRYFLLVLFHEGFSKRPERREIDKDLLELLGDIPFLNGGLFDVHEIEKRYPKLDIPDEAFTRLFGFFDQYEWHLDTRPLSNDREINPDVLGYIFEKYINQKQMGAYYSKEDITDYISKNTVVPYLFDAARGQSAVAFKPGSDVWRLLQDDPNRYIYTALRKGVIDQQGCVVPLPLDIENGIKDISQRHAWNTPAAQECALPTETWREYIMRRQRCLELQSVLDAGEIHEIDDLITFNLDIRQFAEDVIVSCEEPELLRAIYDAVSNITVLDPTCGSGAFLFAALGVLESLYEACLDRMQAFIEDSDRSESKLQATSFEDFRKILHEVYQHPNRKYFIYKSIIIKNIFGVDIMEEAVEICKLRLFLKLVAQIDNKEDLEPLPDIDFNIRPGNTLVGFISLGDVQKTIDGTLGFGKEQVDHITAKAERLEQAYQHFHDMQTEYVMDTRELAEAKTELRNHLEMLVRELDMYLANDSGVKTENEVEYHEWRGSHKPFHWLAEFYGIIRKGGFDVSIGNPPYRELRLVTDYSIDGYRTSSTKNLYPLIIERSFGFTRDGGRTGFIVPVSSIATSGYRALQNLLFEYPGHFCSFDDRPSRLFDGLEHVRLTIELLHINKAMNPSYYSTECYRWKASERPTLFQGIQYHSTNQHYIPDTLPKISRAIESSILERIWQDSLALGQQVSRTGKHVVYYSRKVENFFQVLDFIPRVYDGSGQLRPPTELKELRFDKRDDSLFVLCLLNSSLLRWFVNVFSDLRHVNKREVEGFRCNIAEALRTEPETWGPLAGELSESLQETSEMRQMKFAHDTLRVQCIIPKHSKAIIDVIDTALARHFGFTDEELDFIINYDIKYRIGTD